MVLYTCELCNYKSEYLTRYNEHCMTKKHLRNIEKVEKKQVLVSENKCQHNVNTTSTQSQHNVNTKNQEKNMKTYECGLCGMSFNTRQSRSRHEKKYCEILKIIDNQQKKNESEMKLESKILELEDKINNNNCTIITNNTTNTNNLTINYIKNDKVLNYLNSTFPNAIEMDSFINKIKNDIALPREMMDCFLTCYNNGGTESFGNTLVKYLNQLCKKLDINIFPLCCSDSNLRSHKEKNSVGWETVIDTTKIEEIINHIVSDIFMETGEMINLNAKERKQICNIVKKSYGLSNMKLLEYIE